MSQAGSERREWPRVPATALDHITASVVAGPAVKLVNLSRGGALMEVASRFSMRSRVRLKLSLASGEVTVAEGLVAWARVAAIVDTQVNYLVAVIFDSAIPDLGGLDADPIPEAAPPPEAVEALHVVDPDDVLDDLSQFQVATPREPEPEAGVDSWSDADEQVISLDALEVVRQSSETNDQTDDRVAALAAANETLATQLAVAEALVNGLRREVKALAAALQKSERTRDAKYCYSPGVSP